MFVLLLMKTVKLLLFLTIPVSRLWFGHEVGTLYFLAGEVLMFTMEYDWDFVKQLKPLGYTTVSYRS